MPRLARSFEFQGLNGTSPGSWVSTESMGLERYQVPTASESKPPVFASSPETATVFRKELVKEIETQMGIIVLLS